MTTPQELALVAKPVENGFSTFAILELLGHRQRIGHVCEVQIAGTSYLRSLIFNSEGELCDPQFYANASVYCITPMPEEMARQYVSRISGFPELRELPGAYDSEIEIEE